MSVIAQLLATVFSGGSSSGDPYYANTYAILNLQGINNSTIITDDAANPATYTTFGGATLKTDQFIFGSSSLYCDGVDDYVERSAAITSPTNTWTLEGWFRPDENSTTFGSFGGFYVGTNESSGAPGGFCRYAGYYNPSTNDFRTVWGGVDNNGFTMLKMNLNLIANTWYYYIITSNQSANTFTGSIGAAGSPLQTFSSNFVTNHKTLSFLYLGKATTNRFKGYIGPTRVTLNVARPHVVPTDLFYAPPPVDFYFNNVQLLLHLNGTNGSTLFPDNSPIPKTVTASGSAQISTVQSKFGGGSAYFDGTGDFLTSLPGSNVFDIFSNDFTVEFFVYFSGATSNQCLVQIGYSDGNRANVTIVSDLIAVFSADANSGAVRISATAPATNTWHHVAWVKSGTTTSLYVNGVSVGTPQTSVPYPDNEIMSVSIGGDYINGGVNCLLGYIDELRITKGTARYTTNFAPPTSPFADVWSDQYYNNVSLLLHMNGSNGSTTFIDNSPTPKTVTANGNVLITTAQSKFGGSSAYFDGTGTNLLTPDNSAFDFGSGDFTVECWVYIAANSPLDFDSTRGLSLINSFGTVTVLGWHLNITGNSTTTGTGIGFDYWNPTTNASGTLNRTTATINQNQWNHIAATRSSGTLRIFLNGVSLSITTSNVGAGYSEANCSAEGLRIGATINTSYPLPLNGDIDDLRITKGVARYTADFTPPPLQFPDS